MELDVDRNVDVVDLTKALFSKFDEMSVSYCHWKSNAFLHNAVTSKEDLDVLVSKSDYNKCLNILAELGFKRADSISSSVHPGTEHYYGHDDRSGKLVHFHCYYKIISGDSLVKNYRLPLDKLLLENPGRRFNVNIPAAEAELIALVIRSVFKQCSLVERVLFDRDKKRVRDEYNWLKERSEYNNLDQLLLKHLPYLTLSLFKEAEAAITGNLSTFKRISLFRKFDKVFNSYKRYSYLVAAFHRHRLTLLLVKNRMLKSNGAMKFCTGGTVIALVGPQATGKSTISKSLTKWLSSEFSIKVVHTGKPPSAILTYLPNFFLPLARKLLPTKKSSYIETVGDKQSSYSLIHVFRVLCLAYDRKKLILKLHKECSEGKLIFTDRYPTMVPGAIDSRHYTDEEISVQKSGLKKIMMRMEAVIYSSIPEPDSVIQLTVPVEVAIERDKLRDKPGEKDEEYVRRRHAMAIKPQFGCSIETLSTLEDFSETEKKIKNYVWSRM